jgi:hypothetical protein
MKNAERHRPHPSRKEARDAYNAAKTQADRLQKVHAGFIPRTIGLGAYRIGLKGVAEMLAPGDVARLRSSEKRTVFVEARKRERRGFVRDFSSNTQNGSHMPDSQTPNADPVEKENHVSAQVTTEEKVIPRAEVLVIEHEPQELPSIKTYPKTVPNGSSPFEPQKAHEGRKPTWEWNGYHSNKVAEAVSEPVRDLLFNENTRRVGIIKKAVENHVASRGSYLVIPQTNISLQEFIERESFRLGKKGHSHLAADLKFIFKYIIESPIGMHTKVLGGASLVVDGNSYNLRRVDPHDLPGRRYKTRLTNRLRIIYYFDGESVVFKPVSTHDEMRREYGGKSDW